MTKYDFALHLQKWIILNYALERNLKLSVFVIGGILLNYTLQKYEVYA